LTQHRSRCVSHQLRHAVRHDRPHGTGRARYPAPARTFCETSTGFLNLSVASVAGPGRLVESGPELHTELSMATRARVHGSPWQQGRYPMAAASAPNVAEDVQPAYLQWFIELVQRPCTVSCTIPDRIESDELGRGWVTVRCSRYGHAAGPARRTVGLRRNPCRPTSSACGASAFFAARRASWLHPVQLVRALSAAPVHASTAQLSDRHTGLAERLRGWT